MIKGFGKTIAELRAEQDKILVALSENRQKLNEELTYIGVAQLKLQKLNGGQCGRAHDAERNGFVK